MKKICFILMLLLFCLSAVQPVIGQKPKTPQRKTGKAAIAKTPRLFTSTKVQVQIAGYYWFDSLPLFLGPQVQKVTANRGEKWLAISCKIDPRGAQPASETKPEDAIKLFFEGRQVSAFGSTVMVGETLFLHDWVGTEREVLLVFPVQDRMSEESLLLSVLGSRPAPLTTFQTADQDTTESNELKPEAGADIEQTYRDCIAALQSLHDTRLKTAAQLKEDLEKLGAMMKSRDMSGLQSLSETTHKAKRDFGISVDAYLVEKAKLQKLTQSKDSKTRRQAMNAFGRLLTGERKLNEGQRPTVE